MANNTLIRKATFADLYQITDIYNWAVSNTVATFDLGQRTEEQAEEWFKLHKSERYPVFVLENYGSPGEILGWGSISPFHPRPAYRTSGEFSVYIKPTEFGRGYGSALLNYLCESAILLRYHTLIGLICSENIASLKIATKLGFEQVGHCSEVGFKFNRWLDIIYMQKIL